MKHIPSIGITRPLSFSIYQTLQHISNMSLLLAGLILACLSICNGLGLNEETWPWRNFDKTTGNRAFHLPPWTSIFKKYDDICSGAFLVSNDGYEKMDMILTTRSCATKLQLKDEEKEYAKFGLVSGKFASKFYRVKVKKIHELKCFPNNEYSDGFAIVKTNPVSFEKSDYIYPIRLPNGNEHLSDSGVTAGHVNSPSYYTFPPPSRKDVALDGYQAMLADIIDDSSSVQGKFPLHKTFLANASLLLFDYNKFGILNGMPIASQNEHGEWVLRGIRAVGDQRIFMRVDQCLKEIQETVKEMTSVGGLRDKISKVIPCVGQSCTLE